MDEDRRTIEALQQRVDQLERQLQTAIKLFGQVPLLAENQLKIAEQFKVLLSEGIVGAGVAIGAALDQVADDGLVDRNRLILVLEHHLERMERNGGSGIDRSALEQVLGMLRVGSEAAHKRPGAAE